tara:strand:- start:992 stop:1486 length:495 start_codon:yes stop_codon:yes gene_type:complete
MSIYKKLFEAKKEIGKISKDSKNPFFKSNYLSLNGLIDAVETVLQKHDLLLLQPITGGKVKTEIHDTESTTFVSSEMELPNITDPQKLGSAITYYRRYTLQSLLGLRAEDDDGNMAAKKTEARLPSLTTEQYNGALKGTKPQIQNVLSSFRMSPDQRTELTNLI